VESIPQKPLKRGTIRSVFRKVLLGGHYAELFPHFMNPVQNSLFPDPLQQNRVVKWQNTQILGGRLRVLVCINVK
jgi:hypothetical protein